MTRGLWILILSTGVSACVDSRETPPLPVQAEISFSEKVYLVDNTLGSTPAGDRCTRLGETRTTTTSSVANVVIAPTDGVVDDLGNPKAIDPRAPHNCYVEVKPRALLIDQIEVTNELFQLCIDSGACKKPDPSKASKDQVCLEGDRFDECPVVEVTHTEATTFCRWIGRRLPSMIEHVIARQGTSGDDQTTIPVYPNGSRDEMVTPNTCNEAILGKLGCKRPAPMSPAEGKGAALLDAVSGTKGQIYDLMGNVSEWASDLLPTIRGAAKSYPWFCQGPLEPRMNPSDPPQCPTGAVCVYGQYAPTDQPLGIYPVCVAFGLQLRAISGGHGSLMGGNFSDPDITRGHAGVFARRVEPEPDGPAANEYGFRCAGDVGKVDEIISAQAP